MYKNKKDLEKILPHKGEMVLIDRVIECNFELQSLNAEVDIKSDSIFFDTKNNNIPIWVGIEYMAQTIGAFSGIYSRKFLGQKEPKLGFVIGTRNYECFVENFQQNQTLNISVKQLFFDSELGAFDCTITENNKLLAKAQMNVFQPKSLDDFLKNHNTNQHE